VRRSASIRQARPNKPPPSGPVGTLFELDDDIKGENETRPWSGCAAGRWPVATKRVEGLHWTLRGADRVQTAQIRSRLFEGCQMARAAGFTAFASPWLRSVDNHNPPLTRRAYRSDMPIGDAWFSLRPL
jgi:hypothetical protein